MQARGDHPGGALLEVAQRQLEEVIDHFAAQHGVHPVAGVQHEGLPGPTQQGGEHHEDCHAQGNGDKGAFGAVHHHLVDDGLGEQRRAQCQQLQHQRGQQHFMPDTSVFQQLGHEPPETEAGARGECVGVVWPRANRGDAQDARAGVLEGAPGRRLRLRGAGLNVVYFVGRDAHDQVKPGSWCPLCGFSYRQQGGLARRPIGRVSPCPFHLKAQCQEGLFERDHRDRRRESLLQQVGVKRLAVQGAKAARGPQPMLHGQWLVQIGG